MAGKRDRLSGNEAIAIALRQINPDVFPAFPITPSTEIPQYFASFVANGQVDTEFIPVESEHSSMSAAIEHPLQEHEALQQLLLVDLLICGRNFTLQLLTDFRLHLHL